MKKQHVTCILVGCVLSQVSLADVGFQAFWRHAGQAQVLKTWNGDEIRAFKQTASRERDPGSGELTQWRGVLLSSLLESALSTLSTENKAQIDLVILKNESGLQALIPRALTVKYPVLIAFKKDLSSLDSVIPWTSRSKVMQENLPLESYFLKHLTQVEFTNYKELYSEYFLKKRTDPAAIRGEKIFIQSCMACHYGSQNKAAVQVFLKAHPKVKGLPKMTEKDLRSLESYYQARLQARLAAEQTHASR